MEVAPIHRPVRRGARRDGHGRTARSPVRRRRGLVAERRMAAARAARRRRLRARRTADRRPSRRDCRAPARSRAPRARAPREECGVERGHATGRRVQEVAEHDETRAPACARPDATSALRSRGGRAAWHGDAARAKRRCLAEVHVGDEQRRFARPVERALGEQLHVFPAERRLDTAIRLRRKGARTRPLVERQRGGMARHVVAFQLTPRIRERSQCGTRIARDLGAAHT